MDFLMAHERNNSVTYCGSLEPRPFRNLHVSLLSAITRLPTVRHGFCSNSVRMTGLVSYSTKNFFRLFTTSFSVIVLFPTKIAHFYFSVQKTLILKLVNSEWPASRGTLKSQLHTWNNTFCQGLPGQNILNREWLVTNSKFSKIEKCHETHDKWHWHVNVSE
jgi:hypothetical protein